MFHFALPDEIKMGKITDVYFERTREILLAEGLDKHVTAEFVVKNFPGGTNWGVLAGVEECVEVLKDLNVKVQCMPEGTIFGPQHPVMVIEGSYLEFGVYETAILGFLCQASGVATKAARCRKAAGNKPVISFGARRMHPAIAPMIERNAYIGGCDGVAAVKSAELLGLEPTGTMPHALILILGDTVKAAQAFHRVIDKRIKRVALIDTFNDEKFEAIRVAEALGKDLFAIRLDTPRSRRGDFVGLMKEIRWELDLRGFDHVKIFLSGGLDEYKILEYNEVADAYGVGTSISNAPVLDFAMDIVAIEGKPIAKRGKESGLKEVWRCPQCYATVVIPAGKAVKTICSCGVSYESLLKPLIDSKVLLKELPKPEKIREYVLKQLPYFEL
ncbi:MAG: nicotinate phosphoribosyltransferase [Calditrichaeota bacterium]|nr:MAG: nicotinate phosphoribosyltransferase [Calditrichota bacterium]